MVHRRMSTHGGVPGLGGSRKVRPPGAGHGCGAHETPPAPGWQILPPSPVPIGRVSGASWTKSPNCTQIESAHCGVEISPYHLPGIILDGRTRADIICVQIWLLIHIGPPRRSATSNGAALAVVPAGQKMRAAGVAMSPTPTAAEAKRKPTVAPAISTPRPKVNACRHDSCAQSTPGFPLGVWEVPLASSGPSPPRRAFRNSRDRFASSSMVLPHCQETERALQPAGPIGFCGTRLQCMKMRTV